MIYLVVQTPLIVPNCQLKLLREKSLNSKRPKEIHSRLIQPLNNRKIFKHIGFNYDLHLPVYIKHVTKKYKKFIKVNKPAPIKRIGTKKSCIPDIKKITSPISIKKPIKVRTVKALEKKMKKIQKKKIQNIIKAIKEPDSKPLEPACSLN